MKKITLNDEDRAWVVGEVKRQVHEYAEAFRRALAAGEPPPTFNLESDACDCELGYLHMEEPFEIQACGTCRRFAGPKPNSVDDALAVQAHREHCGCPWPERDVQHETARYLFDTLRWFNSVSPSEDPGPGLLAPIIDPTPVRDLLRSAKELASDRDRFRERLPKLRAVLSELMASGDPRPELIGTVEHILVITSLEAEEKWGPWQFRDAEEFQEAKTEEEAGASARAAKKALEETKEQRAELHDDLRADIMTMLRKDDEALRRLVDGCLELQGTIRTTGGVVRDAEGDLAPVGDPEWLELGYAYGEIVESIGLPVLTPDEMALLDEEDEERRRRDKPRGT